MTIEEQYEKTRARWREANRSIDTTDMMLFWPLIAEVEQKDRLAGRAVLTWYGRRGVAR